MPGILGSISNRDSGTSILQTARTDMSAGSYLPGIRWPGRESGHSLAHYSEFQNACRGTFADWQQVLTLTARLPP